MDEIYIKMAKEAKEIQDNWEPKKGDMIYYVKKKLIEPVTMADKELKNRFGYHYKQMGFWLPRQEDLQRIIYENTIKGPGGLIKDFWDWIIKAQNLVYIRIEDSITAYWLCFVMETCYQKQWNMETQTWETTQ